MGAYKQFLSSDVVVVPFEVNKGFAFYGASALTSSTVNIDRYLGKNIQSPLFDPSTAPTTGQITTQYQELIYESIKHLYYSNFLSGSENYGLPLVTASLIPGRDTAGNVYVGPTESTGRYANYSPTTLTFEKYYPISSSAEIGVISIPANLFGNYIQPNSFIWAAESGSIIDDGEGNLILSASRNICGNIFYEQGLAIITSDSDPFNDGYGFGDYGTAVYGMTDVSIVENLVTSSNVTCSFSSSTIIYESQYKVTISENEYNYTQNPSALSGSNTISSSVGLFYSPGQYLLDNITGSEFAPYVTTIGLYDENQNLLAIGKLAQPLQTTSTTDTTILINIDR